MSEVRISEHLEMLGIRGDSEMAATAYWKYEVLSRIKKLLEETPTFEWLKILLQKIQIIDLASATPY